jgi:hypothetical protein
MGAAEAREQHSKLGLGAQKKTRGQPVKTLSVSERLSSCVNQELLELIVVTTD